MHLAFQFVMKVFSEAVLPNQPWQATLNVLMLCMGHCHDEACFYPLVGAAV